MATEPRARMLLTLTEAARELRMRDQVVRDCVASGEIPSVRLPGARYPRVLRSSIEKWAQSREVG